MRNEKNRNNKEKKKKSLEDYECCTGSRKKASDFEVTTKVIINHIQENFDSGRDVTDALRTLNDLDIDEQMPTISLSAVEDESARDIESRELELDCKGELPDCRKRTRECEKDLDKACAFCGDVFI